MSRLGVWVAFLALWSVGAIGCGADEADIGSGPSSTSASSTAPAHESERQPVIVDLAVAVEPPAGVEAAQDQVVRALGTHGALTRRLTATGQMAVSVDREGRRILTGHPLVARVHDDIPDLPTGQPTSGAATPSGSQPSVVPDHNTPVPAAEAAPGSEQATDDGGVIPGERQQVIVDLAVAPEPPAGVEAAQDEVVGALGTHGALSRRLTATAQMAVSVDTEGRRILAGHPLVASVHDDVPASAN